jgi:transcriptional regulator with XRE-family HTH domain
MVDKKPVAAADDIYRQFGALVRNHRNGKGTRFTQEYVAKQAGLSRTSITNIEKGRQRILLHQLYDLAAALEVPPTALLPDVPTLVTESNLDHAIAAAKPRIKDTRELEWIRKTVLQGPTDKR